MENTDKQILDAAIDLRRRVDRLTFSPPVKTVYNPLVYAWNPYTAYVRRYGASKKRILFLGMNPGPWGMAQIGVPFGEIEAVKTWLGIEEKIDKPENEHPRRPVTGFACPKSEVSGRRLWGLFRERFHRADAFFREHIVMNYCPLVFMADSGANITPDKIAKHERGLLFELCDSHLKRIVEILEPEWCIGIGNFAEKRLLAGAKDSSVRIGRILHPSPASPAANRDWAGKATEQLVQLGVWHP